MELLLLIVPVFLATGGLAFKYPKSWNRLAGAGVMFASTAFLFSITAFGAFMVANAAPDRIGELQEFAGIASGISLAIILAVLFFDWLSSQN